MMVFSPLSGRLVGRRGPRPSLLVGGIGVLAAGLVSALPAGEPGNARLFIAFALLGIGLGWANAAITNTAVSGMPPAQAGVAAAVATTGRQVGLTLGVAAFGAVTGGGLSAGLSPDFAVATRTCWWIVAALGLVVAALGYLTTTGWARGTAARTAERLAEPEVRDLDPGARAVSAAG